MSKAIAENNDKLEQCQDDATKMASSLAYETATYHTSKQALQDLLKKCTAEKAAQYSIKPKKPVGTRLWTWLLHPIFKWINLVECAQSCLFPTVLFHFLVVAYFIHGACGQKSSEVVTLVLDSQWLESWGFDVLETNTPNPVSKEKGVDVLKSSLFTMGKREATTNADGQPASKLTKTKDLIRVPSPLAGKAAHTIPSITALSPVWPFNWFVNRSRGHPYVEAVAAAISILAFYSTFLAEHCLDCIQLLCWLQLNYEVTISC